MLEVRAWLGNGRALPCSACDLDVAVARVGEVSVYTHGGQSGRAAIGAIGAGNRGHPPFNCAEAVRQ
jgi:hypothetical protein